MTHAAFRNGVLSTPLLNKELVDVGEVVLFSKVLNCIERCIYRFVIHVERNTSRRRGL